MQGPTGITGPTGAQGPTGATGATGPQGPTASTLSDERRQQALDFVMKNNLVLSNPTTGLSVTIPADMETQLDLCSVERSG